MGAGHLTDEKVFGVTHGMAKNKNAGACRPGVLRILLSPYVGSGFCAARFGCSGSIRCFSSLGRRGFFSNDLLLPDGFRTSLSNLGLGFFPGSAFSGFGFGQLFELGRASSRG